MAIERIQLVSDEELQQKILEHKIQTNQLTYEEFCNLPEETREKVKETLFNKFARNINPYVALSAVEFGLIGLAKILFKKIEGEELTEAEQDFYDQMKTLVMGHEMTLDTNDWYFSYFAAMMQQVQANRAAYKQKKLEVVGEF